MNQPEPELSVEHLPDGEVRVRWGRYAGRTRSLNAGPSKRALGEAFAAVLALPVERKEEVAA